MSEDIEKELQELQERFEELKRRQAEEVQEVEEVGVEAEQDGEVVDAEFETIDVESDEDLVEEKIVTLVQLGYTEAGRPFFTVSGDKNILVVEGLVDYAKREIEKFWNNREDQFQQMMEGQLQGVEEDEQQED